MEFGEFLGQLGTQAGSNLQIPNSEEIMQRHLAETAAPTPPPSRPAAPPPVPARPAQPPAQAENELKEDSVERVYEATAAIMKTIRKAFPNKAEQQLAYQSICEALTTAMSGAFPGSKTIRMPPAQQPVYRQLSDGNLEQTTLSSFIPKQNDIEGATIDLSEYHQQVNESMTTEDGYTRAIDIKPNQGLTGVSQKDIDDLKKLAGIS